MGGFAGRRTERGHGERDEAQQRAGPLIVQGWRRIRISHRSFAAGEAIVALRALTVVHLNTEQAVVSVSELCQTDSNVSPGLGGGCTHGKAAAKDERANEFAASADAEYRGYCVSCQYTDPAFETRDLARQAAWPGHLRIRRGMYCARAVSAQVPSLPIRGKSPCGHLQDPGKAEDVAYAEQAAEDDRHCKQSVSLACALASCARRCNDHHHTQRIMRADRTYPMHPARIEIRVSDTQVPIRSFSTQEQGSASV